MRLSRALAVLAILALAGPARAHTVLQGLATVAGGYNTNPTGDVPARADFFDDIRPGLRLTSLFDRGMFYAQYTFDATLYLQHGGASGYSNDFTLGTLLLTSRNTSLTLTAGLMQSQVNNIQTLQASASAPVLFLPNGTDQFLSARVAEGFNWDLSPVWRLAQTTAFSVLYGIGGTSGASYDLNNLLDVGRVWQRDALDLQLRIDYAAFPSTTVMGGATVPGQDQLLQALTAQWLHDFGSFFSTELRLGVLLAMRANDGGGQLFEPVARAALHYRRKLGSIDLQFDHTADPSVFTASTLINDTLLLRGGVPLPEKTRMALGASAAYSHANTYDASAGALSASSDLWYADVSLTWSPWKEMSFFLRYSFTDQIGNPADAAPLPTYMRHLAMAGVTITYPAEAAAPVGFRPSVRADRADAVDVPALHAPPAPPPR